MIALYETGTGRLVSYGSTVASPVPAGMTALDLGGDDRLSTGYGYWDAATRSVLDVVPSPADVVANNDTITNRLTTVDMVAMQAILDQTNNALRTDPSQEVKDLAVAVRRLIRKVNSLLDATT